MRVHAADGARLVACPHGGQVLGWVPAGEQRDRLWLSPLARCGPGEAVRGGIPVIFPQFAERGPLPKHGFARTRTWELDTGSDGATVARIAGRLQDDDETRAIWPHPFVLDVVAEASGRDLTLTLEVRNPVPPGGQPFSLTAALHAYLAADARTATIHGAQGRIAEDNAAAGAARRLPDGPLPARGPVDVAVRELAGPVTVDDGLGRTLRVQGESEGFDSLVLWNPGDDHGLRDVPPDGAQTFVCVEPARLSAVTLGPQEVWRAQARFTALVPSSPPTAGGAWK